MKSYSFFGLLLAFSLFVYSCQKGDAGPAGPAGPTGATGGTGANGKDGKDGSTGAKGDTGAANVIYSAWLDVGFQPTTVEDPNDPSLLDTTGYFAQISAPKLSSDILNMGEIKVYMNEYNPDTEITTVYPLPFYDDSVKASLSFYEQTITVKANKDFSTISFSPDPNKSYQFRYVLIPGGVKDQSASKIDWNDYAQVKSYLGIKN
ncbi:hypothetical protein [Pinibacter aurantiacus]|uniref:Collagen-like protein n=1 Tax=Pinibacter aurantiacus TaxID=2851599 RepID=A0A9E2W3D5_9BACT|nr:hypothetical protein [Pinibacter aurantiacus]MBV4356674.1 hypothetical protein [Pinibacter aurantiacus]